jgi:hypothetical protein
VFEVGTETASVCRVSWACRVGMAYRSLSTRR